MQTKYSKVRGLVRSASSKRVGSVVFAGLLIGIAGCGGGGGGGGSRPVGAPAGTYLGESQPIGGGIMQTFVTFDATSKPVAAGAFFTASAVTGLPDEDQQRTILMPPEAAATPFNHMFLNYSAHGHIPEGVYTVPHFDCHFFFSTPAERDQTEGGANVVPDSDLIPQGFAPAPDGTLAKDGWHWFNATAPEFNSKPWKTSYLMAYDKGILRLLEPVLPIAFLKTQGSNTVTFPLPKRIPKRNRYYPTQYTISFDSATQKYRVAFEKFVFRSS